MNPVIAEIILKCLYILYLFPMILTAQYFIIVKIEDSDREDKFFSDKKMVRSALILTFSPTLNIFMVGLIVYKLIKEWPILFKSKGD
jgi:hypothetical protein